MLCSRISWKYFWWKPISNECWKCSVRSNIQKNFLKNVRKLSKYFHKELNNIKKQFPKIIKEVRGTGYLIGLQLFFEQTKFIQKLMDNNLLTIRASENVVRILPPLNVKKTKLILR